MTSLLQKINELDIKVDGLDSSNLQTQITTNSNDISTLQTNMQDKLIAGDNINIVGNTISSSGGTTIDSTTDLSCNTINTTGNISVGGVITAPYQPCFRAYPSQNYSINGDGGNGIKLPYDVIDIDNANGYNITTYQYTIPVAGNWYFYWSAGVVSGRNSLSTIRKNNVIYDRNILDASMAVRTYDTFASKGLSIILCSVGDIINITVNGLLQSSSLATGGTTNQFNSFGGFLIG